MKEILVTNNTQYLAKHIFLMDLEQIHKFENQREWGEFFYLFQQPLYKEQQSYEQLDLIDNISNEQISQVFQVKQVKQNPKKIGIDHTFDIERYELNEVSSTSHSNYSPKKKLTKKSRQYPTKNMLPAIMPLFTQHLETKFTAEQLSHFPEYKKIKAKKNRLNLQSFVELFRVQEFRPIFARYFQEKKIYRDLLKLRIKYPRKLLYFKRIDIFEQAFLTLKFERINGQTPK